MEGKFFWQEKRKSEEIWITDEEKRKAHMPERRKRRKWNRGHKNIVRKEYKTDENRRKHDGMEGDEERGKENTK